MRAVDADVSKTYVEMGMGIAILASVSFDALRDKGLRQIDARHLFAPSRLNVVIRPDSHVRSLALEFIRLFAPAVPMTEIHQVVSGGRVGLRDLPDLPDR
jgi:LysR family cys regulon transcriptional activator